MVQNLPFSFFGVAWKRICQILLVALVQPSLLIYDFRRKMRLEIFHPFSGKSARWLVWINVEGFSKAMLPSELL